MFIILLVILNLLFTPQAIIYKKPFLSHGHILCNCNSPLLSRPIIPIHWITLSLIIMIKSSIFLAGVLALAIHHVEGRPYHGNTTTAAATRTGSAGDVHVMDATPNMPFDPNTDPNCSWWWDNDGSISCKDMPSEWGITLTDFVRWVSSCWLN